MDEDHESSEDGFRAKEVSLFILSLAVLCGLFLLSIT
jgi:hypothetical protein